MLIMKAAVIVRQAQAGAAAAMAMAGTFGRGPPGLTSVTAPVKCGRSCETVTL